MKAGYPRVAGVGRSMSEMKWAVSKRRAALPRLRARVRRRVRVIGLRRLTIGGGLLGATLVGALPEIADAMSSGEVGLPERYEPYRRLLAILLASMAAAAAAGTKSRGS